MKANHNERNRINNAVSTISNISKILNESKSQPSTIDLENY